MRNCVKFPELVIINWSGCKKAVSTVSHKQLPGIRINRPHVNDRTSWSQTSVEYDIDLWKEEQINMMHLFKGSHIVLS